MAQNRVEGAIADLGLTLPQPAAPVASYVPYTLHGDLLFVSGQLPFTSGGELITGILGNELTVVDGQDAAQACALGLLAQAKAALGGDLTRLSRCLRLGGFVACTAGFTDQPKVINGASDLMLAVLGENGRHARAAVGVPSLPLGAAVEIDATFAVSP